MKQPELILGILNHLTHSEQNCIRCSPDAIPEMIDAAREIDAVVSIATESKHRLPPPGEGGVPVALFFFRESRAKIHAVLDADFDDRITDSLRQILVATDQCARALPL